MSIYLDRVLNRIYTVVITPLKEKTFRAEGTRLKYLFFPGKNNCDTLIVGFQACHKDGARYNYVRTLNEISVHKLFIKDDFVENHRGNYYLGSNGQYNVERATYELIDKFIKQYDPKNIIFIGSSKGGYAAVNFGVSYENANIVIAAPQYHLGDYLNCEYQMPNLKDILGDSFTENSVKYLNTRLQKKIQQDKFGKSQKVFIHYSRNDHTYDEHIKDLLTDLASAGISIDEDIKDYTVHGELKFYYPDYLRKSVRSIIQGSKFDK